MTPTPPQWTQGDRMRKAREHAGLTQAELAPLVLVSRRTVSSYELGERRARQHYVTLVAQATGVPLWWINS